MVASRTQPQCSLLVRDPNLLLLYHVDAILGLFDPYSLD